MKPERNISNLKPLLAAVVMFAVLLPACGGSATPTTSPAATTPPAAAYTQVTIEACAATTASDGDFSTSSISYNYDEPPSRAITLNQHATEIMLALGLEDRMVGTAYIDDRILPEFQAAYQQVEILAKEYPSKEVILGTEPDFIYGGFPSAFGIGAAGSQQELKLLRIGSYLTTATCKEEADTIEDLYTDISNIGMIFGVTDRAEALVGSLSQKVTQASSATREIERPVRAFLYDSGAGAPYTSVCCAMFTDLAKSAGATNIFGDVPGRWKSVSWEEVITRDPEVIVLTDAVWSTAKEKMDLLLNTPAYSSITAVKDQRFVTLKFSSLVSGIRNPDAIQTLAEGFYPDRFE